ncbi:MAG: YdcF family protein [Gammaproteobacteria bacterium]|nr:YdcF family protein [Gammaproteobacteria bacterium]
MELSVTYIIKNIIFPPGVILLGFALGLFLLKRAPKAARTILWSSLTFGYLLSTPLVANFLNQSLDIYPTLEPGTLSHYNASAIVILSADRYRNATEYNDDTVGRETLVRLRYGAYIHRQTQLPVIVTGGDVHDQGGKTLAQVMADSLNSDFNIQDVVREESSKTTAENARYTKEILNSLGIDHVFLVTTSRHMPRAVEIFEKLGINVIPAPTMPTQSEHPWFMQISPSSYALHNSRKALHEWLGIIWYKIRH